MSERAASTLRAFLGIIVGVVTFQVFDGWQMVVVFAVATLAFAAGFVEAGR